jgi:hypothetical protein
MTAQANNALVPVVFSTGTDRVGNVDSMLFAAAAAAGQIPNVSSVTAFGFSPATASVTNVNLWEPVVVWNLPAAPVGVEVLSDSASDGVGGTGARKVVLVGVGPAFVAQTEVVTLNGTTVVASTLTWLAINTVIVLDDPTGFGSNGTNVGNITVRITSAGATQGYIAAGSGISHHGRYTVPAGFIFVAFNFFITGAKTGGATTTYSLDAMFVTPNGFKFKGLPQTLVTGQVSPVTLPQVPVAVPAGTTLMFRINNVSTTGIDISAGFTGLQFPA